MPGLGTGHTPSGPSSVVVVHGLYMNGWLLKPLARRIERCGFRAHPFTYHDLRWPLKRNAELLARFAETLPGLLHFVAHSLGGLVVLKALEHLPPGRAGRLVFLGTPYQGSRVAEQLASLPLTRWLLGRSVREGLLTARPRWSGAGELGVIAGDRPLGLGMIFGRPPRPHDGTVGVEETRIPGAADTLVLPVTHTEMLFSAEVAHQVCAFLRQGRFARPVVAGAQAA